MASCARAMGSRLRGVRKIGVTRGPECPGGRGAGLLSQMLRRPARPSSPHDVRVLSSPLLCSEEAAARERARASDALFNADIRPTRAPALTAFNDADGACRGASMEVPSCTPAVGVLLFPGGLRLLWSRDGLEGEAGAAGGCPGLSLATLSCTCPAPVAQSPRATLRCADDVAGTAPRKGPMRTPGSRAGARAGRRGRGVRGGAGG